MSVKLFKILLSSFTWRCITNCR